MVSKPTKIFCYACSSHVKNSAGETCRGYRAAYPGIRVCGTCIHSNRYLSEFSAESMNQKKPSDDPKTWTLTDFF